MSDAPGKLLAANLSALARRDAGLARRLALPAAGDHVEHRGGGTRLRLHEAWVALDVPEDAQAAALAGRADGDPLYLLGVGAGDLLARALAEHPRSAVTAWERDPWLLRQLLARRDLGRALATGRLRLRLGADLVADAAAGACAGLVAHPVLGEVYRLERRIAERRPRGRRAALALGGLFVDDVADALDARGYDVVPLDVERWSVEELSAAVASVQPEVFVAINYRTGLAEFCRAAGVPLACWEIDPTTDREVRLAGAAPDAHVLTYRRANVEAFRAAGFESVRWLPLAADVERRRPAALEPAERERFAAPVAFVGASLVGRARTQRARFLALLRAARPSSPAGEAEAEVARIIDRQRRALPAYALPELLEAELPGFRAELAARGEREDPLLLLAEVAAAEHRLSVCATVARRGLHVWGDDGWRAIVRHGATYRGPAGHRHELTKVYAGAGIVVDVGRLYQREIVTMRVFDALACGAFVIAEHGDDLERLFDVGAELESWRTAAELDRKLAHYLAHPAEARAIAERGLAAVRERHSMAQRVDLLLGAAAAARAAA